MYLTELLQQPEIQHFFTVVEEVHDAFEVRKIAEKLVPDFYRNSIPKLCALHFLRIKAKEKFSQAPLMCFTQRGLEQATCESIAEYKMQNLTAHSKVLMLCAGVGGELIAAGKKTSHITAIEMDPEIMDMVQYNANKLLPSHCIDFHTMLVEDYVPTQEDDAFTHIFIDPDRRDDKRRVSLHAYHPNIIPLLPILLRIAPLCYCKVAPGIPHEELLELPHLSTVEYIEDAKGLKECLLHFVRNPVDSVQVLCTNVDNATSSLSFPFTKEAYTSHVVQREYKYLFEPSPALIRSGAIAFFYRDHGLVQKENSCAYGYTDHVHADAKQWGTFFHIQATIPYSKKNFHTYIKTHAITSCIIKKRYFPMEPQELRKLIKIPEGGNDIFVATTIRERRVLLHCRYVLEQNSISK